MLLLLLIYFGNARLPSVVSIHVKEVKRSSRSLVLLEPLVRLPPKMIESLDRYRQQQPKRVESISTTVTHLFQVLLKAFIFLVFTQKIRNPFLEAVKMTLGDRYTENIESIYKVSINLVIETLVEGFEEAQQSAGPPATTSTTGAASSSSS